jgi:hypothetical protein
VRSTVEEDSVGDRGQLLDALRVNRRLRLTRDTWHAAAILAGLRKAANDPIRATDRDRGEGKNWLADIWGTLGELVALRIINEVCDAPVHHHPIEFASSVNEVDLVVEVAEEPVRLEVKTHLLQPGKDWFMINERAHARSLRRGTLGYVPVLSALGARRALVGSLLDSSTVGRWRAPPMRLNDPAVAIPIGQACEMLGLRSSEARDVIEPSALTDPAELAVIAAEAGRDLHLWQDALPPLDHQSARDVVRSMMTARRDLDGSRAKHRQGQARP